MYRWIILALIYFFIIKYIVKMYNQHLEMNKIRDYIVTVNSLDATTYRTSSDFDINLIRPYDNVAEIELIGGHIPPTIEPYLYMDYLDETLGVEHSIHTSKGGERDAILRYPLPATTAQNLIDHRSIATTTMGSNRRISRFSVQLYNKYDNINSFGTDRIVVDSAIGMSNAINSLITYVGNNNFVIGDIIHIRNFTNGSTTAVNDMMNMTVWQVSATPGIATIQITDLNGNALNLSGEALVQKNTVTEVPYPLGEGARVTNAHGGQANDITLVSALGLITEITTSGTHGYIQGQDIKIRGMRNGLIERDNNKINKNHYITAITAPNRFTVTQTLSSYVTPQNTTFLNQTATHRLGYNSYILHDKFQCSFDIRIRTVYQDLKYTE